jgi:hypothetical protein
MISCPFLTAIIFATLALGCVALFAVSIVFQVQTQNAAPQFSSAILTVTGYQAFNRPCSTCSRKNFGNHQRYASENDPRFGCISHDYSWMATFLGHYVVQNSPHETVEINTTGLSNKDGWEVFQCANSETDAILHMALQSPIDSTDKIWVRNDDLQYWVYGVPSGNNIWVVGIVLSIIFFIAFILTSIACFAARIQQ